MQHCYDERIQREISIIAYVSSQKNNQDLILFNARVCSKRNSRLPSPKDMLTFIFFYKSLDSYSELIFFSLSFSIFSNNFFILLSDEKCLQTLSGLVHKYQGKGEILHLLQKYCIVHFKKAIVFLNNLSPLQSNLSSIRLINRCVILDGLHNIHVHLFI